MAKQIKQEKAPEVIFVDVVDLVESEFNPRKSYPEGAMKELAESIKTHGLLQPLTVRPKLGSEDKFEIVLGHRRARAVAMSGFKQVLCQVRDMTDEEAREAQIVENLQRADLPPLEEAQGFFDYMEAKNCGIREVAERFGKPASYVARREQLVHLIDAAKKLMAEDKFPLVAALELCRLSPPEQEEIFEDLKYRAEYESAENLAALVRDNKHTSLLNVPWDLDDAELVPEAGACTGCFCFSGKDPDLFGDLSEKTCTKASCKVAKDRAHEEREVHQAIDKGYEVLTGKEARAAVNVYGIDGKYVRLTDTCPADPQSRKWSALVGKKPEAKRFMAIDCGKKVEVYLAKELTALAKKAGHDFLAKAEQEKQETQERVKTSKRIGEEAKKLFREKVMDSVFVRDDIGALALGVLLDMSYGANPLKDTRLEKQSIDKMKPEDVLRALALALHEQGVTMEDLLGDKVAKEIAKEAERIVKEQNSEKKTESLKERGLDAKSMAKKVKAVKAEAKAKKGAKK